MSQSLFNRVCKRFGVVVMGMTLLLFVSALFGCQKASEPVSTVKPAVKFLPQPGIKETPDKAGDCCNDPTALMGQPPAVQKNAAPPFGVFDIQSGHGHGKWRKSPDTMVR